MTLEEMVVQVFEIIGEPSDLEIYDYTTGTPVVNATFPGFIKIASALNTAQRVIATWKFPSGQRIRFRELKKSIFYNLMQPSGNFSNYIPVSVSKLAANSYRFFGTFDITESYADAIVTFGSENRLIYSLSQANALILDALIDDYTITGTEAPYLSHRKIRLANPSKNDPLGRAVQVLEVLDVYDLVNKSKLTSLTELNYSEQDHTALGVPVTYFKTGEGIELFPSPNTRNLAYRIEVYAYPLAMVNATDSSELPDAFEEALILYACWKMYQRMQEVTKTAATWEQLSTLLKTLRTAYDFEQDGYDTMLTPINKE